MDYYCLATTGTAPVVETLEVQEIYCGSEKLDLTTRPEISSIKLLIHKSNTMSASNEATTITTDSLRSR